MHARFNNAGSSMHPQRVVSFLTSTGVSPLSFSLHLPFYPPCTLGTIYTVVHRICTSERASAGSSRFSSLRGT